MTTVPAKSPSRTGQWMQLAVVLLSLVAIAGALIAISSAPGWRLRIDATKTRAYSLSELSQRLLDDLQGDWTIALLISDSDTSGSAGGGGSSIDEATRTQVDEVVSRYRQAAPNLNVIRIDPASPDSLVQFDALLARLNAIYSNQVGEYDKSISEAVSAFEELQLFAQQYSAVLTELAAMLPVGSARTTLEKQAPAYELLATEGQKVLHEIVKARRTDDAQPIPDYEGARSILHSALTQWSHEVMRTGEAFEHARQASELDAAMRRAAGDRVVEFQIFATRLATAGDQLAQLPDMELSAIGRQIQEGDAAIILGPKRAAVIPGRQLFPPTNPREMSTGVVRFDHRFRGEQVISSAIRSMLVERMPKIVFVHAEPEPMLRKRARQIDLFGAASVLEASRYEVEEWNVATGKRPVRELNQPMVWIVVSPPQRQTLQPSKEELLLQDATANLIEEGESVLLSVNPSMLPKLRQPDRWATIAAPFGLRIDTGRVVIESVRLSDERTEYERALTVQQFDESHPVGRSVDGMSAYFGLPVPIELAEELPGGVRVTPIATVAPSPTRWLEPDWSSPDLVSLAAMREAKRFDATLPIVVAAARPNPAGAGEQRVIVCGSGGWMLSFVADVMVPIGGERMALANPGNFELLLASVAWLAEMDDLIAPGPTSQQVARLQGITAPVWMTWSAITVFVMPACALVMGLVVWFVRRR
jgi:hypothetical protein